MGITGLLKHLGPGRRVSLSTLATQFFVKHNRPLRLAIDISIWLFQIQAGQGGSNPALRTFYYRLVRLISLNVHPLFVFDGPNKPLFKRNKRVGGPGVRVANIPEFLAKQLLKQFGTPLHIAPGEAEAECALLQRKGVVDAVLSDDVDTMMFGSTLTLRNWSTEGTSKTPTHVNVYKASEVEESSGVDRVGMILVAMMSGGDYMPAGIMGCGPKLAVDAAKAGFAKDLCAMDTTDAAGYAAWRVRLQEELRTNQSKFFTRRNTSLLVPDSFPNVEVLGYYTSPCVSSDAKVEELRRELAWDQPLDFDALRAFAGDAFEWYNLTGAKHFIRNLAPALLARKLRLTADIKPDLLEGSQAPDKAIAAIHGQRKHISVDNAVEIRVSYTPASLVPIDLNKEAEDDVQPDQMPSVDLVGDDADAVLDPDDEMPPTSSQRLRKARPFDPSEPAKLWLLREWVQLGCPAMLEDFETQLAAKERQQRTNSLRAGRGKTASASTRGRKALSSISMGMPANALMRHVVASKSAREDHMLDDTLLVTDCKENQASALFQSQLQSSIAKPSFVLPSTQISDRVLDDYERAIRSNVTSARARDTTPRTPSRRKQTSTNLAESRSENHSIEHYFTPSRSQRRLVRVEAIDLTSSPASSARHTSSKLELQPDGSTKITAFAQRTEVIPRPRPRAKIRKSLSMPTYLDDDLPAAHRNTTQDLGDLTGTAMQPIELSPDVTLIKRNPDNESTQVTATTIQTQTLHSIFTPHKHARLNRETDAKPATPKVATTSIFSSSRRSSDTICGHRVSQVEFLDLTAL